jgi:hypothetical protein
MDKKNDNSASEMVIWSLVVMECWICGQDLGQKQVNFHFQTSEPQSSLPMDK